MRNSRSPLGPWSRRRCFLVFAVLGAVVFASALARIPRYKAWDFGPHHALTRALARGLADGHVPRYLIGVSTGDSPYEMYPFLTYGVAASSTLLLGDEAAAPLVLAILALLCHIGIAALVVRIAAHVAPAPLAFALGLAAFADVGSFGSGATTILEVGLLHGALAQCLLLAVLDVVLVSARDGLRPLRTASVCALAALAASAHPSSLLFLAALLLALLLTAALAQPMRPRTLVASGLQLGIGVLLSGFVWIPFASRVLAYGLHFAYPAQPVGTALAEFSKLRLPPSSFPMLLGLGYLGVLLGLLRRRGRAFLLAAVVALLLLGFTDVPHRLYFDWMPLTLARVQSFRFLTLAQPLLFAAAALPLAHAWHWLRGRVSSGLVTPCGVVGLAGLTIACAGWRSHAFPTGVPELRALLTSEVEDPAGFEQLVEWARERQRAASPDRFARLMWDGEENGVYHVMAESGLPSFFVGDGVALLLREKIEDSSPESLQRFNVRWAASHERAPRLGDARSERRFGSYVVRELPEWDGRLARIERGDGALKVTSLANERIEVDLSGTKAPALVALGIGYYPRWRAQHADGAPLRVYAWPATMHGSVRVVAAWLPPGKSVFVADGPLPSDGAGRVAAVLGLGAVALASALSSAAFTRRSAKRLLVVLAADRLRLASRVLLAGLVVATIALTLVPRRSATALRLVPRLWPEAEVLARAPRGEWTPCRFSWILRDFGCPGFGRVSDAAAFVVGDHRASTPFLTPGIVARPALNRVEFRVVLYPKLQGRYWAAGWGRGRSELRCGSEIDQVLRRARVPAEFQWGGTGQCELFLKTAVRAVQGVTLVRQDALDVDRTRDVPWPPSEAPAELARDAAR